MRKQLGATTVEFALVLMIFLTFLLGVLDFGRMLWTWNAANEATRWGARVAVVCDVDNDAFVLAKMQTYLPQLTAENVKVDWYVGSDLSTTCTADDCTAVNVSIEELDYQWISPIGFGAYSLIRMPSFSTYLPREIMGQDPDSASVCS